MKLIKKLLFLSCIVYNTQILSCSYFCCDSDTDSEVPQDRSPEGYIPNTFPISIVEHTHQTEPAPSYSPTSPNVLASTAVALTQTVLHTTTPTVFPQHSPRATTPPVFYPHSPTTNTAVGQNETTSSDSSDVLSDPYKKPQTPFHETLDLNRINNNDDDEGYIVPSGPRGRSFQVPHGSYVDPTTIFPSTADLPNSIPSDTE